MDNAAAVLYRPSPSFPLARAEPRFGKSSQGQQVLQFAARAQLQFGEGERVQPQEVVATLQRTTAKMLQVEPATSGNQNPLARPVRIVQSLEKVAPLTVLVYFIKQPEV